MAAALGHLLLLSGMYDLSKGRGERSNVAYTWVLRTQLAKDCCSIKHVLAAKAFVYQSGNIMQENTCVSFLHSVQFCSYHNMH